MSILIDLRDETWMSDKDLKALISLHLPGVNIYCGPPDKVLDDVQMVIMIKFYDEYLKYLPNLRLIQKAGAGVETIFKGRSLPNHIKVCRMSSSTQAKEISQYCLAQVLSYQHNMWRYSQNQFDKKWEPYPLLRNKDTTVGVLGLGKIGKETATLFSSMDFKVCGWSKSPKNIPKVQTFIGSAGFKKILGLSNYVVSILPETPETVNLINKKNLANFKKNSVLINVGRGSLVVEDDLVLALDSGQLKGAVLDVTQTEPLPISHPFWEHPKITITPHVSGWNVDDVYKDLAENYLRLVSNAPIPDEINREKRY